MLGHAGCPITFSRSADQGATKHRVVGSYRPWLTSTWRAPLARRQLCSVAANVRLTSRPVLLLSGWGGTMKLLRVVAALVGIAVGATVVAAGPLGVQTASAAPVHPVVRCRTMQSESNSLSALVELSGCNRPRITGGSGTNLLVGPGPYPITWKTRKETNIQCAGLCGQPPSGFRTPSRCTNPLTREYDWVGSVATVLGPWTKRFIGDTVAFDVCLTSSFGIDGLVPGTVFMILKP
jgi:hypothetical protein